MSDARKQTISLRISTADLRKVRKLARRLGTRDSDVIRFALKIMLARLGPYVIRTCAAGLWCS
jgi:hypothetical protein